MSSILSSLTDNLDQIIYLKVSRREHTSFLHGGVMYSLAKYSSGFNFQFVRYNCRSGCYFSHRKSW